MIFSFFLQVMPEMPKSNPGEWGVWIIGVLIFVIVILVYILKWIVEKVFTKVDAVLAQVFKKVDSLEIKFEYMHKEATTELKSINTSLINQSNKMETFAKDLTETKYAIQNIECVNDFQQPQQKKRA